MRTLSDELLAKKTYLEELSNKAEVMIDQIKDGGVQKSDFDKVKIAEQENTNRLDKIQKDDKMLNLLLSRASRDFKTLHITP